MQEEADRKQTATEWQQLTTILQHADVFTDLRNLFEAGPLVEHLFLVLNNDKCRRRPVCVQAIGALLKKCALRKEMWQKEAEPHIEQLRRPLLYLPLACVWAMAHVPFLAQKLHPLHPSRANSVAQRQISAAEWEDVGCRS